MKNNILLVLSWILILSCFHSLLFQASSNIPKATNNTCTPPLIQDLFGVFFAMTSKRWTSEVTYFSNFYPLIWTFIKTGFLLYSSKLSGTATKQITSTWSLSFCHHSEAKGLICQDFSMWADEVVHLLTGHLSRTLNKNPNTTMHP